MHARNIVFRRVSLRNDRVDPIRIDVYRSALWADSNVVRNLSFFQIDNYENGNGAPFVMLVRPQPVVSADEGRKCHTPGVWWGCRATSTRTSARRHGLCKPHGCCRHLGCILPKSASNNRADRDISFTNVRIHNNDSRYQCQDAFRLVQPVRNLRLTDVSVRPTATPFRLATMAIRSAAAVVRVADD